MGYRSIETKGTFAEQYIGINKIAIDFAKKHNMTTMTLTIFFGGLRKKIIE